MRTSQSILAFICISLLAASTLAQQHKLDFSLQDDLTNWTNFMTAIFQSIGLPQPTQIINCFTATQAQNIFNSFQYLSGMVNFQIQGNHLKFLSYQSVAETYFKASNKNLTCMFATSDWANFLAAAKIPAKFNNYTYFHNVFSAFLYARPYQVATFLQNLSNLTQANQYSKAGQLIGSNIALFQANSNPDTILANEVLTMFNGFFLYRNLGVPTEFLDCVNVGDSSFADLINFYTGWGGIWWNVTNANLKDIGPMTKTYMEGKGASLINNVNATALSCIVNSTNGTLFAQKTGYDLRPINPTKLNNLYNFVANNSKQQGWYKTWLLSLWNTMTTQQYMQSAFDIDYLFQNYANSPLEIIEEVSEYEETDQIFV